ncbi:MAG: hypothetical protein NTW25_01850 [Candidatus Kapabacteria bacterium]|nr:hypothetical protein [Candidatus Kapabacteria bacterium]
MKNQNLNASWRVNNLGDWVKSYKVYDHLGSLRVEGIGVGNDLQSYYDYKPFGGLEDSGTKQSFSKAKTRLGYVDMPKDKESNLGDHGIRKYDSAKWVGFCL